MKILLIDDDPEIIAVAVLSLEKIGGFSVRHTDYGEQAVALTRLERPDAILLDYYLQDTDGGEVLLRLQADPECRLVPVVFLTAKSDPALHQRWIDRGARGVIQKPFDPFDLPKRLLRLLPSKEAST